jgi:hypothetical protein
MGQIASHRATAEFVVVVDEVQRVFPYRKSDFNVDVRRNDGTVAARTLVGSVAGARKLANLAWTGLRDGRTPDEVWQ